MITPIKDRITQIDTTKKSVESLLENLCNLFYLEECLKFLEIKI